MLQTNCDAFAGDIIKSFMKEFSGIDEQMEGSGRR